MFARTDSHANDADAIDDDDDDDNIIIIVSVAAVISSPGDSGEIGRAKWS